MTRRRLWVFLGLVSGVVGLTACGSGTGRAGAGSGTDVPTSGTTVAIGTTTAGPVAPKTVAPSTGVPTTVAPAPGYVSLVATAVGPTIAVYDRPDPAAAKQTFPNPWAVDPSHPAAVVAQVFLVEERRADGWVRVLLPVRPNGSTGWVREANVTIHAVTYAVKVEMHSHRITVFDRGAILYRGPVAIGKPSTPTPTGRYYVRVLIKATNPHTVYGPYAYGLSSHSDALSSFDGGDAEIGLHGNDDASVLGHDVTHGCIRMDNAEITKLAALLPLGTPVDILS